MTYPFQDPKLPLKERIKDLVSRLTTEEKIGFIPTRNYAVDRLGIPAWGIGGEGAHGFVNREGNNTTFPQTIGLAASWDKELLKKVGEVVGIEARCHYIAAEKKRGLAVWSPTIDLERDPRWGRTEEGYGEDPFLTSELSCGYIRGVQGDDPFYLRASCSPKHFFANNNEEDRGTCSCSITPRLMHEYYLVPFKNAIQKAGAVSLMTAYNEVNGIPMMLHPILKDFVKDEWGLKGHIVTDGGDVLHTVDLHHYFETHGETLAAALKSGADSMTDMPEAIIEAVKEALERKLINESDLNEHVERVLEVRFRFGQFDPPQLCPYEKINEFHLEGQSVLCPSAEYNDLSREAVRKSVVLLKNEECCSNSLNDDTKANAKSAVLPLKPDKVKGKITIMGPLADDLHLDWYAGRPAYKSTPLESLRKLYGDKIEFTDCRDIVSFTAEDGRPMVLINVKENADNPANNEGEVQTVIKKTFAAGALGETPARFRMEDWGWGAKTFTDTESGLMLEGCYGRREVVPPRREPIPPEQMPKTDNKETEYTITATAKNNLAWFGYTLFNLVPQENGFVLLKTHDNRRVALKETNGPVFQHDDPLPVKGELFKMKIECDGAAAAREAAAKSEQVLFFAGNDPMINGRECIDRPSLNLPPRQEELINVIAEVNPRTAVIILSGYPFTCKETAKKVPAILWMAHGIQETGNGLADIISGDYSPAGRTPLTWYEDEKQLPSIMEYDIEKGKTTYQYFNGKVLWPFGHGLSYTNFEYSELKFDKTKADKNDIIKISFKLKNAGSAASEEVPQLYTSVSGSVFSRPIKSLKGFTCIFLNPGEEKSIIFELPVSELAVWDSFRGNDSQNNGRNCFIVESGYCTVQIGASSADIRLSGGFEVIGENPFPRKLADVKSTNGIKQIYAQIFDDYSSCYLHEKRGSGIPAVFSKTNDSCEADERREANESWLRFSSLDFGAGFSRFSAVVQSRYNCRIEIRLDAPDGLLAGTLEAPNTGDVSFYPLPPESHRRLPSWGYFECPLEKITGVHDLYLVLRRKTGLWRFGFSE